MSPVSVVAPPQKPSPPASQPQQAKHTQWVLTVSCQDGPGIVAAVTGIFADRGEFISESQQFGNPASGRFFMRLQVLTAATYEQLVGALQPVFDRFNMTWKLDVLDRPLRTIVMVSKAAHCLTDLLYRERSRGLNVDIVGIVGNHTELEDIARFYGKPFAHIPVTAETKAQAESQLRQLVHSWDAELVVLARYMQILSDQFCSDMAGRIIKIGRAHV